MYDNSDAMHPAWSPDGERVALQSRSTSLIVAEPEDDAELQDAGRGVYVDGYPAPGP